MIVSVIVPTFNEEDNVRTLTDKIEENLIGIKYEIIFVDDSIDETPRIIKELVRDRKNIRLIRGQGKGLASAVILGFQEAEGDYLCVLDADFQHPPEMVRRLLEKALDCQADIVIGSRYCKGGGYAGLKGPLRKLISVCCKELARVVFSPKLNNITDPLGGLFLIKRNIIGNVSLRPRGFKILLEILIRCDWETVREIPYQFAVRADGKSKADINQGLTFLRHVAELFLTTR